MAGRVLARTRSDGEVPVRLMNVTGAEARIPRGTVVGNLWWAAEDEEPRYEEGGFRVNKLTAAEGDTLLTSLDLSHLREDEARKGCGSSSQGTWTSTAWCTRRVQHRIEILSTVPAVVR